MLTKSPNPLQAELSAPRAASGLYAARLNLDFALSSPVRVYTFPGYLTESRALAAGRSFAAALGRASFIPAKVRP